MNFSHAEIERRRDLMKTRWGDPLWVAHMAEQWGVGHPVSPDTRQAISEGKRGIKFSMEGRVNISLAHGGVSAVAAPLLLRGASVSEVMYLGGFERKQVQDAKMKLKRTGELPKPTGEQISQEKSRGQTERGRDVGSEDNIGFARELVRKRLIGRDLTSWNNLQELYIHAGRPLPDSFASRLRAEAWMVAQLQGKHSVSLYQNIAEKVDPAGFKTNFPEEEFVYGALFKNEIIGRIASDYNTFMYSIAYWRYTRNKVDAAELVQRTLVNILSQKSFLWPPEDEEKQKTYIAASMKVASIKAYRETHAQKRNPEKRSIVYNPDIAFLQGNQDFNPTESAALEALEPSSKAVTDKAGYQELLLLREGLITEREASKRLAALSGLTVDKIRGILQRERGYYFNFKQKRRT